MRPWSGLRPMDLVPGGMLLALGLVEVAAGSPARPLLALPLTVLMTAPLLLRRRVPLTVFASTVVAVGLLSSAAPDFSQAAVPLSLGLATFTVGHRVPLPRSIAAPAVLGAVAGAVVVAGAADLNEMALGMLTYGGVWGFGAGLRLREEQVAALAERALRAELERDERAQHAVEHERARIARELHDIVSHSISLIAVQAQAVRLRLGPDAAREANDLGEMEVVARHALGEMRRLLGVLRPDGEAVPLAPQPGLDQLDRLVTATRATGLDVEVAVVGDAAPLAPGVDLAAYRIIQEALTNVRRHARARHVDVLVRYREAELEIVVEDDGAGGGDGSSAGHGLVGMRERVALYGGTISAGPADGEGFRVHAVLPMREVAVS